MSTGSTHTPSSALEHDEIELKLEIDPESMDQLAATEMLSGLTPKIIHQVSTYFDTPDQDLRAAGLSLRVRTAGGRHVQTIKASGGAAAGLFARPEWEHDVAGLEPDIRLGSPIFTLVEHETLAKIKPAFTVTITRTQWVIEHDGGTVELVADTGSITAIDRVTPISELELELKGGSPTALFALANTLGKAIPLRLGVLTKAERGYRLIGPAMLDAVKTERLELAADTTTAEAFAQIAGTCLRHFRLNETILRRGPDPEALHQTRVALRRLRSALSIFKPAVADDRFPNLASELKWLAGSLGPARDLDVLRARLGSVVNEKLMAAHADAYTAALDALNSQRTRDLMIALVEWTALGTWRVQPTDPETVHAPVALFADTVIGALRRRMKRRGHDLDHLDDEARHRIRIIAKKLRYATGFFQSLYTRKPDRRRFKVFTRHLEALQDHLGILNDLATAPALMERFDLDQEASLPPAERQQILSDATEAFERLIAAKRFW